MDGMKILAIETSADDTGIAILEAKNITDGVEFKILANKIHTQIDIHTTYGGIFPMVAKREHGKYIIPTLEAALKESGMLAMKKKPEMDKSLLKKVKKILERENDLGDICSQFLETIEKPDIDIIAVTVGPGLEPALWVGISVARALSTAWNIPIIPVNHMEGHLLSILPQNDTTFIFNENTLQFPMLSLLISGGHTELVLVPEFGKYKVIGSTRDDAAGEAFDKAARMLDLPYPGGPEIARLAKIERENTGENSESVFSPIVLPRPMIHTKDYDFSFSGLKTAVLYLIRDIGKEMIDETMKSKIAKEFEDAVVEVLLTKTLRALEEYKIKTLILGGGVSSNIHLQKTFTESLKKLAPKIAFHFPTKTLSTDNALMIAIAGYFQYLKTEQKSRAEELTAQGNLAL